MQTGSARLEMLIAARSCRCTIKTNGDKIIDAKFKTFGCGAAIRYQLYFNREIRGATLDER